MVAYKSKFGEILDHVQYLPLATGVNECCRVELSQYLFVAKASFHLHELLHVFLCGHIAVIEEFKRKQIIKCVHTIVDEA
jgi:hypothetical protein